MFAPKSPLYDNTVTPTLKRSIKQSSLFLVVTIHHGSFPLLLKRGYTCLARPHRYEVAEYTLFSLEIYFN